MKNMKLELRVEFRSKSNGKLLLWLPFADEFMNAKEIAQQLLAMRWYTGEL